MYLKALKPKKVLILAPCFAEYERALKSVSAEITYFELKESDNFYPNIENLKKEIELITTIYYFSVIQIIQQDNLLSWKI